HVSEGQLYAATVADFSGGEPLIHREKIRTERSDLNQLNGPNFVSSFAYEDYVFFFYRETAVEYMNCGKAVYSRVGRVCQHDKGGPHAFSDRWTSFLKARLNCSVPGEYPFYFNEIREYACMYTRTRVLVSSGAMTFVETLVECTLVLMCRTEGLGYRCTTLRRSARMYGHRSNIWLGSASQFYKQTVLLPVVCNIHRTPRMFTESLTMT
ncbi:semaphorin-1A-like, partial [Hylaeus volcanicus]|uniref:semaphorin-1A-like n=1 Tax=Hylaeus volcanicus TaxID=313075 RepID=UPI0023B7AF0E